MTIDTIDKVTPKVLNDSILMKVPNKYPTENNILPYKKVSNNKKISILEYFPLINSVLLVSLGFFNTD